MSNRSLRERAAFTRYHPSPHPGTAALQLDLVVAQLVAASAFGAVDALESHSVSEVQGQHHGHPPVVDAVVDLRYTTKGWAQGISLNVMDATGDFAALSFLEDLKIHRCLPALQR